MKTEEDYLYRIEESESTTDRINFLKEYARIKCKEQRVLCCKSFDGWDSDNELISIRVLDAPEPDFD